MRRPIREGRPMGGALRCLAVVLTGLVLAPGAAYGDATIDHDPVTGLTEVSANGVADAITVTRSGANDVFSRTGGGLTASGGCSGGPNVVTCPQGSSLSVDLGAGADTFD